ncbi:MAG: cytidylate kinase family protein [Nitrososphaerota archaeon]|nr:cytidylate kinase family protein [Candidatus Calditenuaceae archaeon]MDW8072881.1 cytidylate kinase family protein [Nitrososphaerota archaeon]
MLEEDIVVIVSGLAASGKSTLAKQLAEKLRLKRFSGGEALKTIAAKMGFDTSEERWWESDEGMRFLALREGDERFDRMVDEELLSYARRGGVVIDSWVLPWLFEGGFKVWLKADRKVRAERLARRAGLTLDEAARILEERDARNAELYRRLYGIKISTDFEPFHLVIDTTRLSSQAVLDIVYLSVRHYLGL